VTEESIMRTMSMKAVRSASTGLTAAAALALCDLERVPEGVHPPEPREDRVRLESP
jgi:hypothetical protein